MKAKSIHSFHLFQVSFISERVKIVFSWWLITWFISEFQLKKERKKKFEICQQEELISWESSKQSDWKPPVFQHKSADWAALTLNWPLRPQHHLPDCFVVCVCVCNWPTEWMYGGIDWYITWVVCAYRHVSCILCKWSQKFVFWEKPKAIRVRHNVFIRCRQNRHRRMRMNAHSFSVTKNAKWSHYNHIFWDNVIEKSEQISPITSRFSYKVVNQR